MSSKDDRRVYSPRSDGFTPPLKDHPSLTDKLVYEYMPWDCPNFADCDAPMCPLDPNLPDTYQITDIPYREEVCRHVIDYLNSEAQLSVPQFERHIKISMPYLEEKIGEDILQRLVHDKQKARRADEKRREHLAKLNQQKQQNKAIEGRAD